MGTRLGTRAWMWLAAAFAPLVACATPPETTAPDEAAIANGKGGSTDPTAPSDPGARPAGSTDPRATPGVKPTLTAPTPSSGCAKGETGERHGVSIDVHGHSRYFDIVAPTGDAATAHPLVFVFHGGGGQPEDARAALDFPSIPGAAERAVFVYPAGNDGNWDLDSAPEHNDDIAFFDAMVASLTASYCIDRSRIFATGASMGGYFSNQLGCRRGDVLRAIAPHAGGGPFGADHEYDDSGSLRCNGKPVAAMVFHGADDDDVSVSEGLASVNEWRSRNACSSRKQSVAPQPCVAYDGCQNPVVWCRIPGLGHDVWSQGAQATWDFFSGF